MTSAGPTAPAGTWCAIPVYNNGRTAAGVARECRRYVERVLVVDDGSTDCRLGELLADTDVVVLRHERNRGKGAALLTALAHVRSQGGRFMITLDGDGQHLPEDIPSFFPLMEERPDALLVGCRDLSGKDVPGSSRFGRRFSNAWVRLETGRRLPDTQSGFRVYPVAAVAAQPLVCRRFDLEIEVLVRHAWAGLPIESVPVAAYYPPAGERVSHFDKWRDNARLSRLHGRLLARRLATLPLAAWRRIVDPRRRQAGAAAAATPEKTRRRGNRLGFWCFSLAIRLTGLRGAYGMLRFVCLYYLLFDRLAVRAALAYLARRFPGRSRPRLLLDSYRLFVTQGQCLIDRGAALHGVPFEYDFHGKEQLDAASGRGFVLLLAHAGNWQLALSGLGKLGRPVCLLMRPQDSPALDEYLRVSPSGSGIRVISPDSPFGGVIELLRHLSEGWIVCIMGDRGYGSSVAPVRFLGDTARFPVAAYRIAAAAGCPVLVLFAWRSGEQRYDLEAPLVCRPVYQGGEDRATQLQAWAQAFASELERFALAHPYQVFLFQDVWRPEGPRDARDDPPSRRDRSRPMTANLEGIAGGDGP